MAKKRSRRKQDDLAIGTLLVVGILGLAISVNQQQTALLWVFVAALALAFVTIVAMLLVQHRKLQRLARSGIHDIDEMSGLEFERYLQALLLRRGYKQARLTTTYDLGVDLTAEKDGVRWAIQAKRYRGAVGLDAVRQVVAAASHYKCDKTMVITNSHFTRNAHTIARSTGCVLVDREALVALLLED